MWCCRRIEVIIWSERLKSEDVLQRIAENKIILKLKVKVKVKQSGYRPTAAQRVPGS
jgi:hypothetical protein